MKKIIDNCVGCKSIFGSCMKSACPYHRRVAVVCDECENEEDTLYRYQGKVYCLSCLLDFIGAEEVE